VKASVLSTQQHPRRWEPWEIVYLKRYYARAGVAAVASTLKRGVRAVKSRLTLLNLQGYRIGRWTGEEDAYLRKFWGKKRARQIGRKLRRSWQSVTGRAERLGLTTRNIRRWTKQEIEYLRQNYLRVGYAVLARHLGRNVGAVNREMQLLGLRKLHEKKHWTIRERRLVRKKYGKIPRPQLARMLNVPLHVLENLAVNMNLVGEGGRAYSRRELDYIRAHYQTMTAEKIARRLRRTPLSIRSLASKRGWKGRKSLETRLTQSQQSYMRMHYRKVPGHEIARHLGLPLNTVRAYARRVGLVQLVKPFTEREHRYIESHIGKLPVEVIAHNLGRGVELVRDYGNQQGWEFRLIRAGRTRRVARAS
jgi:hypothetical protein